MKSPLLTLITLLIYVTAVLARYKELCVDLGRLGLHDIMVDGNPKYSKKLARQNDSAEKGRCTEPTEKFTGRLARQRAFCKNWNRDHVTILAPGGLTIWVINEVGATTASCGADEDNFVEMFE